jgi:deoxyribonuclease I
MKGLILSLVLVATSALASTNRQVFYGQEFYQNFPKGISKDSLTELLNEKRQTVLGYNGARKVMFGQLYKLNDSRGTYVLDVYCNKKFYFRDVTDALNMHSDVNTEHTWPQSRFSGRYNKDMQKSDLHHLFPTDSEANSRRANYDFGEVEDGDDNLRMNDCEISQLGSRGGDHFDPPTSHRGNVARALFYFSTRYDMEIDKTQETYLRKWHKEDPIDENERQRHETIYENQKNRNPFIDHPELVDTIKDF